MLLRINSTSNEVRRLQRLLNAAGCHPRLVVDGIFGPLTERAVKHFQARHVDEDGLPLEVDGIVGAKTWWALTHRTRSAMPDVDDARDSALALRALLVAFEYHAADVRERPPGSNRGGPKKGVDEKYSVTAIQRPFFPEAGQPWCAMFVWQCFTQAGLKLKPDGFAAVITWVRWARRNGYLHSAYGFLPRAGDLFCVGPCINFQTAYHIGFVEKYNGDGTITTIEGNSGDRVASRIRPVAGGYGGERGGGGIRYYIRILGR